MPHLLEVGIPDTFGLVICMADVVAYMRRFAAEFTYSAHNYTFLSHGAGHPDFGDCLLRMPPRIAAVPVNQPDQDPVKKL